jgi:hypothetical protein
MSRVTRIGLATLLSLVVVIGIYTSVAGASLSGGQERAGSHLVSGAMVNLDHYRASASKAELAPQQISPSGPGGPGQGCQSEHQSQMSPDD